MSPDATQYNSRKNQQYVEKLGGESAGVRTLDLLIKSQLLYRLSYALPCEAVKHSLESGRNIGRVLRKVNPEKSCFNDNFQIFHTRKGDWL